jgi:hypothetical protein
MLRDGSKAKAGQAGRASQTDEPGRRKDVKEGVIQGDALSEKDEL